MKELIAFCVVLIFTVLTVCYSWSDRKDKDLKIESFLIIIDSLNEEINYLKGLEDECFPVAME